MILCDSLRFLATVCHFFCSLFEDIWGFIEILALRFRRISLFYSIFSVVSLGVLWSHIRLSFVWVPSVKGSCLAKDYLGCLTVFKWFFGSYEVLEHLHGAFVLFFLGINIIFYWCLEWGKMTAGDVWFSGFIFLSFSGFVEGFFGRISVWLGAPSSAVQSSAVQNSNVTWK